MAIIETTDETTSDETTTSDGQESSTSTDDPDGGDPGLLARLSERARQVADLVAPFSNLLTAVVQAATVTALVRNA